MTERPNHGAEREPELPQVGLLEVVRGLDEGDWLILSRNQARHMRHFEQIDKTAVHYEDLNYLSDIYRPISPGKLVTDEFKEAATSLARYNTALENKETYPLITVINDRTEDEVTEVIDVASLIAADKLPVYQLPARSTRGGEMVKLGYSTLIRNMAQRAGLGPIGLMAVDEEGSYTIDDIGIDHFMHLPASKRGAYEGDPQMEYDRRGSIALALLQLDTARTFDASTFAVTEVETASPHLVVRIATQPDLQTIMLQLVDLVESHNLQLVYSNSGIATGEIGSVFSVADDTGNAMVTLSEDRTLDMALNNAYLYARECLPER